MKQRLAALILLTGLGAGGMGCTGNVSSSGSPGDDKGSPGGGDTTTPGGTTSPSGKMMQPGGTTTPGGTTGPGGTTNPGGPGGTTLPPPSSVGASPLRRLSKTEYANTVRDLFGPSSANVAAGFVPDSKGPAGYTIGSDVSQAEATQYQEAAERLASDAAKDLGTLLPCDAAKTGEEACAAKFVTDFGKRVYRRPLITDEVNDLKGLYSASRKDGYDHPNAIRIVLETMLQSPNFLYRGEFGVANATGKMRALTTFEVASRLSYFFWQSMPDAMLLADAESGELAKADVLEKHARRLLADDRARASLEAFGAGWMRLEYGDVVKTSKDFTPQVKDSMTKEVTEFLVQGLLKGDLDVSTLFTADYTWADSALAKVYGVTATGNDFQKLSHDPMQGRSGLLTSVAFLAKFAGPSATSPTRRGVMVREQFLCQEVPPPPPNLNPTPPAGSATQSVREQVDAHKTDPSCSGCHNTFDPIGLSLESFSEIGKFRTTDGGKPVDSSGQLSGTDVDGALAGAKDLGTKLGKSDQVRKCMTAQMFRFALARMEDEDKAALDRAYAAAVKGGKLSLKDLMVALAKSEAFLYKPAN